MDNDITNILLGYIVVSMAWRDLPVLGNQVRRRINRRARILKRKLLG